jgi:hypothetical protein
MTRLPREPLTDEERELAERLARLDASAAPSAALDARILATARNAVGGGHRARRRPRWPVALGVAATLALAVGIAWQLRPAQDGARVYSEAPAAASTARGARGPSADDLPTAAMMQGTAAPEAPQPSPPSPADAAADLAGADHDAPPVPGAAAQVRYDAAEVHDSDSGEAAAPSVMRRRPAQESADIRFVPPPAPRPPQHAEPRADTDAAEAAPASAAASDVVFDVAEAAPPSPLQAAAPAGEDAAAAAETRPQGEARRAKLRSKPESEALDQVELTGSGIERDNAGFSDQALDDQPPATADSPEVQRAWLQRIRELLDKGDTEGARASLAEFKRRYPRYALPEDLRELHAASAP